MKTKTAPAVDPITMLTEILAENQRTLKAINARLDAIEGKPAPKAKKITKMQAADTDLPEIPKIPANLRKSIDWLIEHVEGYEEANGVVWDLCGGDTYFRLYHGKTKLGLKNRRLWAGKKCKATEWGNYPLKGEIIPLS